MYIAIKYVCIDIKFIVILSIQDTLLLECNSHCACRAMHVAFLRVNRSLSIEYSRYTLEGTVERRSSYSFGDHNFVQRYEVKNPRDNGDP